MVLVRHSNGDRTVNFHESNNQGKVSRRGLSTSLSTVEYAVNEAVSFLNSFLAMACRPSEATP